MKNILNKLDKKSIILLIDNLFLEKDLWFISKKYNFINEYISIEDYLNGFTNISYNSRYHNWNIKNNSKYVIIDNNKWFLKLSNENKKIVLKEQISNKRGMIIDSNEDDKHELNSFIIDNKLVLYGQIIKKLSFKKQKEILFRYLSNYDNLEYDHENNDLPEYIKIISNKYVYNDGFNCFASVLYCAFKDKSYLEKWVNQNEFSDKLSSQYKIINDIENFNNGDIIIFKENDTIVHTAYCIGHNTFINKNGQSLFNPILIKNKERLLNEWSNYEALRLIQVIK